MAHTTMFVNVTPAEFQEFMAVSDSFCWPDRDYMKDWLMELSEKNGGNFNYSDANMGVATELRVVQPPRLIEFNLTVNRNEEEQGKGNTVQ